MLILLFKTNNSNKVNWYFIFILWSEFNGKYEHGDVTLNV